MTSNAVPLLGMRGITKRFPGVLALDDASLEVDRGEVLALVGENGAGKSTLMKVLGGVFRPDAGEILLDGTPVEIPDVATARGLGIALIHQELMLAPNLDIAGNIFLGAERRRWGPVQLLDRASMCAGAAELMRRVGLDVSPRTPLRRLTTGQMQMVEIAKALGLDARIIVMDEPTSSLTLAEAGRLFEIIAGLRRDGIAVVYISHRMEEVLRIADRVTVMRDGRRVADLDAASTSHDEIVSAMVGREFSAWFPEREHAAGEVVLRAEDLLVPGAPEGVTFDLRRGEILGFAGLVGSGRTELLRVIFGADQRLGGRLLLDGEEIRPRQPADAIALGIYLAPEDRKLHGLVLPMTVAQNISLPDIGNYEPRWLLQRGREREVAVAQIEKLGIRTPSPRQRAVNLSGGNQQKVVLAKWLARAPRVLILDEPTRGIDVGAKTEIYALMDRLAQQGVAILMISSDLEEVLGMSDRVLVMHQGNLAGELGREALSEEAVMRLATGGTPLS
jgi:ribose transport system ATP-binding protein